MKFVSESAAGQAYKALHGWIYNGTNSTVFQCRLHILMLHLTSLFFILTVHGVTVWNGLLLSSAAAATRFLSIL